MTIYMRTRTGRIPCLGADQTPSRPSTVGEETLRPNPPSERAREAARRSAYRARFCSPRQRKVTPLSKVTSLSKEAVMT